MSLLTGRVADDSRHNSLYRYNAWFKALQTYRNRQGMTDWVRLVDFQMKPVHIESTLQFYAIFDSQQLSTFSTF
jgi:hypothetical protein